MHVSYQTYLHVVESALLLEFVPLLLKNIQGLIHVEFRHEISDEIIDNYFPLQGFWNLFLNYSPLGPVGFKPF
jgi:hypothetical protein